MEGYLNNTTFLEINLEMCVKNPMTVYIHWLNHFTYGPLFQDNIKREAQGFRDMQVSRLCKMKKLLEGKAQNIDLLQ